MAMITEAEWAEFFFFGGGDVCVVRVSIDKNVKFC
jgi:hypothetical protein